MNNIVNLDLIIRKADPSLSVVPGEEKLITIELASSQAIEKTLLVRFAGNFQDYIVANNRNPLRTISAKLPTHYVRDGNNSRTLAIDIALEAIGCPAGKEAKVAEALHGQLTPGQIFAGLIQRWVREFIAPGDEARFIDTYDAARHHLEQHIANKVATHT